MHKYTVLHNNKITYLSSSLTYVSQDKRQTKEIISQLEVFTKAKFHNFSLKCTEHRVIDFCTKYCQQNLQKKPKKRLRLGFLNLKDNAGANKNKQISRFSKMKVRAFLPSVSVAGTDVNLQFNKISEN